MRRYPCEQGNVRSPQAWRRKSRDRQEDHMRNRENVVAAFVERGADGIDHPGGTLLAHLIRVSSILDSWSAPEYLVAAGLAHAAYGTDGFDVALFGLEERAVVAALVGDAADAVIYRYASSARTH